MDKMGFGLARIEGGNRGIGPDAMEAALAGVVEEMRAVAMYMIAVF